MKDLTPSSDPLPNARHEAFAREVALGRNATQAYAIIYGVENRRVASSAGHRLMQTKSVAARIKAFQEAGADSVAMNLREIHDFLTRVKRTPAGEITPSSDLCTRVKHTRDGGTDVWMPDKLACVRLSAKLQGFLSKPAPPSPPPPPEPDNFPILTEERRRVLMARRAEAIKEFRREEEQRPSEPETRTESSRDATGAMGEPETRNPKPPPRPSLNNRLHSPE